MSLKPSDLAIVLGVDEKETYLVTLKNKLNSFYMNKKLISHKIQRISLTKRFMTLNFEAQLRERTVMKLVMRIDVRVSQPTNWKAAVTGWL